MVDLMRNYSIAAAVALIACGGGQNPGDTDAAPSVDGSSSGGDRGPRALPPTIVDLELNEFPRPAAEACAANTNEVMVSTSDSIADALAAATPGTTVWVAPGTYTENAADATALQLSATDVCIRAADDGEVVIEAAANQRYGLALSGSDLVLEGITLRGFESGVGMDQADTVTLERVRVDQMTGDFRDGIVAYGVTNRLLILDSHVEDADLSISCNTGPCTHWWIESTTVNGLATGSGNSGADAFAIEAGRQIVVLDSTFSGATGDGIDTKARDVVVYGARVYDVERNGVKLWYGGDVIDTVISGTGADASLIGDQPGIYRYLHVLVADHDPNGSGYVGTWGYDAQGPGFEVEIVNSIFYETSAGGLFVPAQTELSIRNTIFDDATGKLVDIGPGTQYQVSELDAFESAGHGTGNTVGAPMFTDAPNRDFSTNASSPARDAAEVIADLDRDIDGNPRTRGAGPDIGPVESP
jgi:hypothetical protein